MNKPKDPSTKARHGAVYTFKRATLPAWKIWRRLSSPARVLPDFLIIGAQKAGTTSLYEYLSTHPHVIPALKKEIKFFDLNYAAGINWYRSHFPFAYKMRSGKITGESSPYMIFHPLAPQRVKWHLPKVRLIALLRDPVDRAYSHYQMNVRTGREHLSFEEALEKEVERLEGVREKLLQGTSTSSVYNYISFSYLAKGCYAEQLERWYAHFPPRNILVLRSEELFEYPQIIYSRAIEFLELSHWELPVYHAYNRGKYTNDLSPRTRNFLADYFRPHNRRLFTLLGEDFAWQT
jgi:plasmid stabilization system protein ParE